MKVSDISPATAIPIPQAPTRPPPAVNGRPVAVNGRPVAVNGRPVAVNGRPVAVSGSLTGSMEAIRLLADEHERIAHGLNDVVVRRLFSAGLDLQAALNLIGDQRVADKIERVLDELDRAIRDLRNTVFDRWIT